MVGLLIISLSINKTSVQLFYITGRFFYFVIGYFDEICETVDEIYLLSGKRGAFLYFDVVTR